MNQKPFQPRLCENGKRITVDGIEFRPYQVGISRYQMWALEGRLVVARNYHRETYSARVGSSHIKGASGNPKRFRTERAAMEAAVALHKKGP